MSFLDPRPRSYGWFWKVMACQTGAMTETRRTLIDTSALLLTFSAARIRKTSPLGIEVTRG